MLDIRYYFVLKRLGIISSLLILCCAAAWSQYDPSYSHYWAMEPSFNPAAAGKETKLNIVANYQIDFAGFEHNPQTAYIGADMPVYFLKNYHGVGLSLLNDKIGLFTHQKIAAQYAYRFKLLKGNMAIGVSLGMLMENFDGTKVDAEDSNDPALPKSEVTGNSVDIGAGLFYTHGNWYVGVSGQHLNAPKVELGETNELNIEATYYLTGGYNIKLRNPFLSIPTNALVRYDGHDYRADVGARLVYKNDTKMLYTGASYSPDNSATVLLGGSFHGINLGYSYEIYISGINPGNGSHGLFLSYQTDINLQKKGKNKHKSVRIL